MKSQTPSHSENKINSGITWMVITRFTIIVILMLAVLFLAAGRINWWEGWAYVIQAIIIIMVSRGFMMLKNPDLIMERAEAAHRENIKSWDRILMPLVATYGPLVSWIIAGLDVRFGWSPDLPDWIQIIALAMIAAGSLFGSWAMITNRFFSSQVRIQTDRGHTVISNGPYRFMRHPAYAGGLVSWIAAPFFFSSYWVAIPSIIVIVATILRTELEDRTLQEELPGYKAYAQEVRYRLVPGIW
jgi:protein-S-isoprenylcysteine O-methyltransferase Ste14